MISLTRILWSIACCLLMFSRAVGAPDDATKELYRLVTTIGFGSDRILAIETAIRCGADVNYVADPSTGISLLHYAASRGDREVVGVLMTNHANPTVRNMLGEQPWKVTTDHNIRDFLYVECLRVGGVTEQDAKDYERISGHEGPVMSATITLAAHA